MGAAERSVINYQRYINYSQKNINTYLHQSVQLVIIA